MDSLTFKKCFLNVLGRIDKESDLPVPWYAFNYWDKVQWAAYVGECSGPFAIAFGINIEFLPTWRKVRNRITEGNLKLRLSKLSDDEWHWYGRPGYICKNPPVMLLSPHKRVIQVNIEEWLVELDSILDGSRVWPDKRLMRPQLQIMRKVGSQNDTGDYEYVSNNIKMAIEDMKPLIDMLSGMV